MKVIEVFCLIQPLYFLFQLLNPKSNFLAMPTLVLVNKIHQLSGIIIRYLESFHINVFETTTRPHERTILRKVTIWLCFPCILGAKLIQFSLLFLTRPIHSLSGHILNYLQPPSDQNEDVTTDSTVNGWLPNLYFYLNRIPFQPSGEYIDEILLKWYGNYKVLLTNQDYIEWLFPNKDVPSNRYASILSNYEAQQIKNNPEAMNRVMNAFQMMLDFWGMEMSSDNEFTDSQTCHERYKVLNNNPFLAAYITRILKMFKELNLQQVNSSWLAFLSDLIFKRKKLRNLESIFIDTWVKILPNKEKEIILSQCVIFY